MELAEMAGLQEGDTIFFIAAPERAACIYAGQIRNELGKQIRPVRERRIPFLLHQ